MVQCDLKKSTVCDILKSKKQVRLVMKKIEGGPKGKDVCYSGKLQHNNLEDCLQVILAGMSRGCPCASYAAQRPAVHLSTGEIDTHT